MAVKIRLSRGGSKKRPYYRIVAADVRAPRDGRFIERLGSYNPMLPKDHADRFIVDADKVKAWIAKGAKPTEKLEKLFSLVGICEAPARKDNPKKAQPKAKALERIKEKEEKVKAAEEAKLAAEAEAKAQAEAAAAEAAAAAAAPVEEVAPAAEEVSAEEAPAE